MIGTDWLKQWNLYSPEAIAFQNAPDVGERAMLWSYADLYRLSGRVARFLRDKHGISNGDRVAVLASNEMEYVALFFGIIRLGAMMTPINHRLTPPEIAHILQDSEPKLLVHQTQYAAVFSRCWSFEGQEGLSALLANPACDEDVLDHTEPSEDDACMILYTSGTTGRPKGAIVTRKMLFWNSINTSLRLNLSQSDVALAFLPFFHTGGWNVLLTPFVHRGARTIIMRKFDAAKILQLCASEGVTILFGVPTTMEMMAREPTFASVDLSSVRFAVVGGEPMPIELIKKWQIKGVAIRQGYGLTEFGPNVFSLGEADSLRKIGSIGHPNFYIEAKIMDENDVEISDQRVGELLLRGPACTPGYWRNEAATRETIRDGWLRTGDLVRRDEDGYYFVAGRKKDMFISGGENVYPVEIEQLLSSHPAIREVAVVGVPDARWGEVGKAYVARFAGAELSESDVFDWCSGRLAKFKTPKQIEFVADLPKGDSGKILKRLLPRLGR